MVLARLSAEEEPQAAAFGVVPVVVDEFPPPRRQPGNVLDVRAGNAATVEKAVAVENDMFRAKPDEAPHELPERQAVLVDALPVDPADLIVLAIGIVVAVLGASEFIPRDQHGDAL